MGSELDKEYRKLKEVMFNRRAGFEKYNKNPLSFSFKTYEEAEEYWDGGFKAKIKDIESVLGHQVDAERFKQQLVKLYSMTNDQRFADALDALDDSKLAPYGKWVKDTFVLDGVTIEERMKGIVYVRVNLDLESGMSRRLAFASWAAKMHIYANSFPAAVKWVERVWREYRELNELDSAG